MLTDKLSHGQSKGVGLCGSRFHSGDIYAVVNGGFKEVSELLDLLFLLCRRDADRWFIGSGDQLLLSVFHSIGHSYTISAVLSFIITCQIKYLVSSKLFL